jgi:hypothetical protein
MTGEGWVDHDPEGFAPGTSIEHVPPTCDEIPGAYVQPSCSQWTEVISIPMAELPPTGSVPAADGLTAALMLVLIGAALIRRKRVA